MGQRKAVTAKLATAYRRGSKNDKSRILYELVRAHRLAPRPRPPGARADRHGPPGQGPWASVSRPTPTSSSPHSPSSGGSPLSDRQASRPDAPGPRAGASPGRRARDRRRTRRRCSWRWRRQRSTDASPAARRLLMPRGRSPHKARDAAQVPDPDPHLVGVGRRPAGLRRGRPRRPRGREPLRGVLLHAHDDRRRHGLYDLPLGAKQGRRPRHRGDRFRETPVPLSAPRSSTPTTARSSSTPTCSSTASPTRSPSPALVRGTRTTGRTSSRRTGRTSASSSATCASTPTTNSSC